MRPRLRARRLLPFVGLVVALLLVAACTPPPPPSLSVVENDVFAKHFMFRSAHSLPELQLDDGVSAHAQQWADTLAAPGNDCGALQHSNIVGTYAGQSVAENIACVSGCPANADVVWNLWMNSPGHLTNIQNPGYNRIGIGVTCNAGVEMYVVQYLAA
jgi:uncharacterized protein YkwD